MVGDIVDDGALDDALSYIEGLEARLAACEALVNDVKLLAHILSRPAFEGSTEPSERAWDSSGKDAGSALFAILKKHEVAIRGETNDEQAG